ncbi:MAG TPA: alpha/beta hydrolase, partial [Candidatus Bathyarchaeia archaeon]|nr:alpha/beta hydrolase [Candidatus Bathyarchaeia archaeon]
DFARNPKEAFIRNVRAELGFDTEDRLHEIKHPTLIIVGEKDRLLADAHLTNRLIPGSKLVVIKGSGHSTCIENPEDFNRAVLEFLE